MTPAAELLTLLRECQAYLLEHDHEFPDENPTCKGCQLQERIAAAVPPPSGQKADAGYCEHPDCKDLRRPAFATSPGIGKICEHHTLLCIAAGSPYERIVPGTAPSSGGLVERLRAMKSGHVDCDDCWYSCAILTCDDKRKSDKCDCGADATNAVLEEAATALAGEGCDAARLNSLEKMRASVYASFDNGRVMHWVVVDETKRERKGNVANTLRDAIEAARRGEGAT